VTVRWLVERNQAPAKPVQASPTADGHSSTRAAPESAIKEAGS
jgi:hypothetical protein